jgi:branched-chain amino acid transport system substrate-binding protein
VANSLDRTGWKVDMIGGCDAPMAAFINNAGKNGNGATTPLTFIEGDVSQAKEKAFVDQ